MNCSTVDGGSQPLECAMIARGGVMYYYYNSNCRLLVHDNEYVAASRVCAR